MGKRFIKLWRTGSFHLLRLVPDRLIWVWGSAPKTSRMSRRRSTGDLVPRDITEILAREARAQRGQKKSGSSLGHAFSWLKGSRKKKSITNGLRQTSVGVMDAKVGFQNHEPPKGEWVSVFGVQHFSTLFFFCTLWIKEEPARSLHARDPACETALILQFRKVWSSSEWLENNYRLLLGLQGTVTQ